MIIYNVTIKLDWSIHEAWLHWMKQELIPDMLATNFFFKSQMVRLIDSDEEDGPTYAVQYYAESIEHFNQFIQEASERLKRKSTLAWGNSFVVFDTLMEVVN